MSDLRATCWSVTINNPNKADDENIAMAKQKSGWAVYGQKEVGENGTEHYQLMITTPQVRFSAIKKAFPRSHIEVARDRKALTKYVNKEDTRIAALPKDNNYPSMSQMWDDFSIFITCNTKKYGIYLDWTQDKRLVVFDDFVREQIMEGKFIETMAVNPQVRSCVKNYLSEIHFRSLRRQTDRQTDEKNVEVESINDGTKDEIEEVEEDDSSQDDNSLSEGSSQESSE